MDTFLSREIGIQADLPFIFSVLLRGAVLILKFKSW
jgi:hypothetical protein